MARLILLLCLVSLSFGCAMVGPDYSRPETAVLSRWPDVDQKRVTEGPVDYRAWWSAFEDPVLDRLVEAAYEQNLSLKVAGVRVLEARAQLGIAVGELFPQTQQVNGSYEWNRVGQHSTLAGLGRPTYVQDELGAAASWEIDFWGKFRRAIQSADALLLASLTDYDNTLVSLVADVANAYISIRTLEKRIAIARENVDTQRESLKLTEARFHWGSTSERDVAQAKTVLADTEASVPTLQSQLQQENHALSILLGLPPGDLAEILGGAGVIPTPPPQIAVGIPADLLRRRPDVRQAEYTAMAQAAQIGVAKAQLFPSFSLTGTFAFISTTEPGSKLSDIFRWSSRDYTAGPGFQWNVLNYGRLTNNVRVQDARFQELLITYQNAVLKAQQEVEDGLTAFLRSQERAELLAVSTASAKRSLDLAVDQYRGGIADFTTVLVAEQSLLSEQDSFAVTLGTIASSLVAIYRALGGGWQISEGKDVVPPEVKEAMAKRSDWGGLLEPADYLVAPDEQPSLVRPPDW